jgi:hypothetical protein
MSINNERVLLCILTFTNPHLTRTPHPANVIPLHNRGNKIPVAGSLEGASMTGSLPIGAAPHCAAELLLLAPLEEAMVSAATSRVAARRRGAAADDDGEEAVDSAAPA